MGMHMESWPQRHRITVRDYHRMGEIGVFAPDARVELIEGEIIDMAPIGNDHQSIVDQLNRALVLIVGDRAIVRVQGSIRLSQWSEPQPDVVLLKPRSDFYRGVVCDDEGNQAASRDAFELLHQVVARRLAWKRFTVVDATNLQADARKSLLELARKYHYLTAALVFDLPEEQCQQHNRGRPDRTVPPRVITTHAQLLRRALAALPKEGFIRLYFFRSTLEIESALVQRTRMWSDRRDEFGE